jgi:hypothetical protein
LAKYRIPQIVKQWREILIGGGTVAQEERDVNFLATDLTMAGRTNTDRDLTEENEQRRGGERLFNRGWAGMTRIGKREFYRRKQR